MKRWCSFVLIWVVILGLILPVEVAEAGFEDLPAGFADELVIPGVQSPTAMAWLPDGTLLVTAQAGQVYRKPAAGSAVSILNLGGQVCSGGETGLLGIAVHPSFAAGQRFVYLYYTHHRKAGSCGDANNRANRVSRFTMDGAGSLGNEQVLIDNIAAPGGNHNGGDIQFGQDGMLYIAVGDGGKDFITGKGQNANRNARLMSVLNGKILRVTPDGAIPPDNPFVGASSTSCAATGRVSNASARVTVEKKRKSKKKKAKKRKRRKKKKQRRERRRRNQLQTSAVCGEIYATGLRNPYRIAFDPDDATAPQRLFINDVGGGAWEELNEAVAGGDYGWNVREGPCVVGSTSNCAPDNRFIAPFFAYDRSQNCRVITGGAFVPTNSNWPDAWQSSYLFADMGCNRIFAINENNPALGATQFGRNAPASHLAFGPDGALYYADFGEQSIRRIVFNE